MRLFSYVVRFDDGAAPNPFWGYCTLVICKPVIRRTAKVGDWVIGTGSKAFDLEDHVVYAMKITAIKTLRQYDVWCKDSVPNKIPDMNSGDYKRRAGDAIYEFHPGKEPRMRESVHSGFSSEHDLSGKNALISDHFYYFGEKAIALPPEHLELVKRNQGHKKIQDESLIIPFIEWLETKYPANTVAADPQMPVSALKGERESCMTQCIADDTWDDEIVVRNNRTNKAKRTLSDKRRK